MYWKQENTNPINNFIQKKLIKELIVKSKIKKLSLPSKTTFGKTNIANEFNNFLHPHLFRAT